MRPRSHAPGRRGRRCATRLFTSQAGLASTESWLADAASTALQRNPATGSAPRAAANRQRYGGGPEPSRLGNRWLGASRSARPETEQPSERPGHEQVRVEIEPDEQRERMTGPPGGRERSGRQVVDQHRRDSRHPGGPPTVEVGEQVGGPGPDPAQGAQGHRHPETAPRAPGRRGRQPRAGAVPGPWPPGRRRPPRPWQRRGPPRCAGPSRGPRPTGPQASRGPAPVVAPG